MMTSDECIIGKKGEILPKKNLREISGINPGDKVYIEALPGKLIIKKIYSVEELLKRPSLGKYTLDQINKELEEESNLQELKSVQKIDKHIR
jgi:bifunctional DNA-binding transcriptional regulator/antitoxin component of YhaV-PrlF toxin-antitoxin module